MQRTLRARIALLSLGVLFGLTSGAGAVPCDRIIGVNAPNGGVALVKHFTVPAGATITGLEFVSNDVQTVFPRVILAEGSAWRMADATVRAEFTNVRASGRHRVQLEVSNVVVSADQDFYVAVTLPASTGIETVGEGAGLGGTQLEKPGSGNYLVSAAEGELQAIDVNLAMRLFLTGVGKSEADAGGATPAIVARTFLGGARPNPATGAMTIAFGVERTMAITLSVYDIAGRRVRTLVQGSLSAGAHSRSWDGRDDRGQSVAAGVYIARLQAGPKVITQKLVMTK